VNKISVQNQEKSAVAEEPPEREERVPFQYDEDEFEPAGFERIKRERPHRAPRENDGRGRRPNRDGKPLW